MSENEESKLRDLLRCGSVPKCRIYRVDRTSGDEWRVCLSVLPTHTVPFSEDDAQTMCQTLCPSLFEDSPS